LACAVRNLPPDDGTAIGTYPGLALGESWNGTRAQISVAPGSVGGINPPPAARL
jgi:hypothetical protein